MQKKKAGRLLKLLQTVQRTTLGCSLYLLLFSPNSSVLVVQFLRTVEHQAGSIRRSLPYTTFSAPTSQGIHSAIVSVPKPHRTSQQAMHFSKIFVLSLVAALSSVVASADTVAGVGLAAKRVALENRMHARAHAGHGALKKRKP